MRSIFSKFNAPVLICILCILANRVEADELRDAQMIWALQIKKIHIGMKQFIVVGFLPQRSEGTMIFAKDGKSYTFTYALDKHWSVATVYDRSGYSPKNNPYSTMGFPNDKVIGLPRLRRQE